MSRDLQSFLEAALQVGLAPRLASLTAEVEAAIASYPPGPDKRYLDRLHSQLDRLRHPDLPLVARLVAELCAADPDRLKIIAPTVNLLAVRHPCLASLQSEQAA
uniref:Uncharacterized protein n=1 Tax=Caulobacter sp. (strain K31) TaxID=366602 RepID=B0T9A2_CAUSK